MEESNVGFGFKDVKPGAGPRDRRPREVVCAPRNSLRKSLIFPDAFGGSRRIPFASATITITGGSVILLTVYGVSPNNPPTRIRDALVLAKAFLLYQVSQIHALLRI